MTWMRFGEAIRWRRLGGTLVISVGALGVSGACSANPPAEDSVRVFRSGRELPLPSERAEVRRLVERCVERLATADNVLRLAVSAETIAGLKRNETALEVVFAEPRTVTLELNGADLRVGRLLVPLTGEFAQGSTVIFYGPDQAYGSGPLRNDQGSEDLLETVLELARSED